MKEIFNECGDNLPQGVIDVVCGWIPPDKRTPEIEEQHVRLVAEMPPFQLIGAAPRVEGGKVVLWDGVRSINGGKHLNCFYQEVGSCVGQGASKAVWYVEAMEIVRGEPEQLIMPYEPYTYAQSRVAAGISGNEDGSTGAGAAAAVKKYGILSSVGRPGYKITGQTVDWDGKVDRAWGRAGAPAAEQAEGAKHLIRTTALCKTSSDVAIAIQSKYPCTCASDWGGLMKPPIAGSGATAVRLNKRADTWPHQMMICGWWDHPQLGEIFYIQNSWGEDAHGVPAQDEPPGGFWIAKTDMDYICRQREVFAYSQFDGFPADMIPWIF